MKILATSLLILLTIINANSIDTKLAKKGAKIASVFCDENKLPKNSQSLEEAISKIKSNSACKNLSNSKLKAVATYILNKNNTLSAKKVISVPKTAKCPVCGMFVSKYPKWVALMNVDGKHYFFDGVKDMMKFYFFDGDFKYDRNKIKKIKVTNYYTLEPIDAKKAYYVIGSNKYGPMGNELIPFTTKKEAQNFLNDYKGEKIVRFNQITPKMVMALDGIELK